MRSPGPCSQSRQSNPSVSTHLLRYPTGALAARATAGHDIPLVAPLRPEPEPPPPSHNGPEFFHAGDFRLESGAVIPDLVVCYETWGQANQFRTNVILVCHGRGGDRLSLGAYIGPGKAFDTDRYFVVAVDAIGAGLSTTPASSGLGMRFPRYNIRDMVRAQCLALTTGLGLTQIRCVVGPSMGSYMALEWAVNWPPFVRSAVCMVPSARCAPHLRAVHEAMRAAITADPEWPAWEEGDYQQQPTAGLSAAALAEFPWSHGEEWYLQYQQEEHYQTRIGWAQHRMTQRDPTSVIYQSLACDLHDVALPFGGDLHAALQRCRMPVLLMPCATDQLIPPRNAQLMEHHLANATYVEIPSYAGHAAGSLEVDFVSHHISEFLGSLHR